MKEYIKPTLKVEELNLLNNIASTSGHYNGFTPDNTIGDQIVEWEEFF